MIAVFLSIITVVYIVWPLLEKEAKAPVKVKTTPVKTSNFCSQCGAKLKTGDKFCSQCGNRV